MLSFRDLKPGDHAPWFHARCTSNERYAFDTVAGRWIVLCFFGSAAAPWTDARRAWIERQRQAFDDVNLALFGISVDPDDERLARIGESLPGVRQFWDVDGAVSRAYGALPMGETPDEGSIEAATVATSAVLQLANGQFRPLWFVLNPALQVRAALPFMAGGDDLRALEQALAELPARDRALQREAPVIVVPDVFEAELCQALIASYEAAGGAPSGFMREQDGQTIGAHDPRHKVRRDHLIDAEVELCQHVQRRVVGRLVPALQRAYQFNVSRMERYLVACYDAAEGAHFRAHRDNTTKGTAHRRFAVTINLNADFDGGGLSFPEFGARRHRPPPGAALVFSCSLMHQVDVVTRGRRFAFLPFLYDEAAAALRDANLVYVAREATGG